MNPFTLDFSKYKEDILMALLEVYGNNYSSLIEERFNSIYFVPYVDYLGIKAYYDFLCSCESRKLTLEMLKIIGIDIEKYNVTNYADEFTGELKNICHDLLGGSCLFEDFFINRPNGFKAFFSKYADGYSEDTILENKINFINAIKGDNIEKITEENFREFSTTEEYKCIENLANYYYKVFDLLLQKMNAYTETIKEYDDYYKKELERKNKLLKDKLVELYSVIYKKMNDKIKRYIDSLEKEEDKIKALFSSGIEYTNDIEYFSDEYEKQLVDLKKKEWIIFVRKNFLKTLGVDSELLNRDYNEIIQYKEVKDLIINPKIASEITELRKLLLEEAKKEFIQEGNAYKQVLSKFYDNQSNRDAIFNILVNNQVCVNGGYNENSKFIPIIYYTLRYWQCGCMDYVLLHEIIHAIESVAKGKMEYSCGFEVSLNSFEWSKRNRLLKKRKYERFNEVLTDILALEVCDVLHNKNIYMFDDQLHSLTKTDSFNTCELLKNLLRDFYVKYRDIILEARLTGNLCLLTDYIGERNFEELNDIIDNIDFLVEQGLVEKLKYKVNDGVVEEYNLLLEKLKCLYVLIDDNYQEEISLYNFKKRP